MTTILWNNALEGVTPAKGGAALPPATYRFRAVAGEGKKNNAGNPMLELQFEVVSGPLQGRKQFHNENLPTGNTDNDRTRMAFFLGLMDAYGITGDQLKQMFGNRAIDVETVDYIAKQLVAMNRIIKATVVPQQKDTSRVNLKNFVADDGIEPEPPKQVQAAPAVPGPFGQAPGGPPQGGFAPPAGPPQGGGFPGGQAGPPAGGGMPLGGFPGSGGMQPNPAPDWANQPAAAQQGQPQQFQQPINAQAPAAQPQAGGMNQFTQPAAAQVNPALQEGFPGQQFPGQVNPNAFPAQGQQAAPQQFGGPVQGFQGQPDQNGQFPQQAQNLQPTQQPVPGQQMPGIPQAQQPGQFGGQPQGAPGLPTGGFPQQGGAPQANF